MPKIRRHNVPEHLLRHLLARMRERQISHEQITLLADWLETEPEVPSGNGSRSFPA
jgi:ribosomal protein S18 acetylase RimI-like enzyme